MDLSNPVDLSKLMRPKLLPVTIHLHQHASQKPPRHLSLKLPLMFLSTRLNKPVLLDSTTLLQGSSPLD
jgi:hypothetical protein